MKKPPIRVVKFLARPAGFEPAIHRLEICCIIHCATGAHLVHYILKIPKYKNGFYLALFFVIFLTHTPNPPDKKST